VLVHSSCLKATVTVLTCPRRASAPPPRAKRLGDTVNRYTIANEELEKDDWLERVIWDEPMEAREDGEVLSFGGSSGGTGCLSRC
jgi:hypothetical protein